MNTILLRYRDLITAPGGTVEAHATFFAKHGSVWWGWWMRQYEIFPRAELGRIQDTVDQTGFLPVLLFDSGSGEFTQSTLIGIACGVDGERIASPEPHKTPTYYGASQQVAWFQLRGFRPVQKASVSVHGEPTLTTPSVPSYPYSFSVDQLRESSSTMWLIGA